MRTVTEIIEEEEDIQKDNTMHASDSNLIQK